MATYTVEIQAGNEDGTIWQAMHPAENVADTGTAKQVALDVLANQNVLALDDNSPWRIAVWNGADADTGGEPDYALDDVAFHDGQADALDAWEAGRVD